MKVTHFQRDLGINSNSYGRFMKLKGPYSGIDNQTYHAAHAFFLQRERSGIKAPRAKKAKAEDLAKFDVSNVQNLPGEEEEDVSIYDTCDDIRAKIQSHLRQPGITQASFLREIVKTYTTPQSIQSKQLSDFLSKRGANSGNTSRVYYASYVYFEKLRLKWAQEKTKKRKDVEKIFPGGMERDRVLNWVIARADERMVEDEFGRITFHRR